MQFIQWEDNYNTGVKEIDNQHRGLFEIINKLSQTNRIDPEGKYFFVTFGKLIEYARIHFSTEERYMKDANYTKLDEHRQEHIQFLEKASNMLDDIENKKPDTDKRVLDYIKTWYSTHILGTDREYIETLRVKGFK